MTHRIHEVMTVGAGDDPGLARGLRLFWLDGMFSSISDTFWLAYLPLYAAALGAGAAEIGIMTAVSNLLAAIALLPGARFTEKWRHSQLFVVLCAGIGARLLLLALALVPLFMGGNPTLLIGAIILFASLRAFLSNLANPAWIALSAEIVPLQSRGRYFASRNFVMSLAALIVAPLAGQIIGVFPSPLGYQVTLALALLAGLISVRFFSQITVREPQTPLAASQHTHHTWAELRRDYGNFIALCASAFVFNLALQAAAPFFNLYLVQGLGGTTFQIGILAAMASLSALFGQARMGTILDRKGPVWLASRLGLIVPIFPLIWAVINNPWQVSIVNLTSGIIWAGYNLAIFNLLLEIAPAAHRARFVAIYQTVVFSGAFLGPLIGGWLVAVISYQAVFVFSAIGRLVGALLFIKYVHRPPVDVAEIQTA